MWVVRVAVIKAVCYYGRPASVGALCPQLYGNVDKHLLSAQCNREKELPSAHATDSTTMCAHFKKEIHFHGLPSPPYLIRNEGEKTCVNLVFFSPLLSPTFLLTHLSTRKLLYWLKCTRVREKALLSEQNLVSLPSWKQELRIKQQQRQEVGLDRERKMGLVAKPLHKQTVLRQPELSAQTSFEMLEIPGQFRMVKERDLATKS